MIMFGVIQILCSLIPDFNNMSWLSAVAAVMSGFYSTIGLGLGIARVVGEFRVYEVNVHVCVWGGMHARVA